jgi:two-component system, cell cycle sensor histidine kinase and response regulator CckA
VHSADDKTVLSSFKTYATRLMKAGTSPSQCRVLVVDDEHDVRRYVEHVLKAAGYQTSTAGNAAEAIEAFKNGGFDALVTDVMMPGMTGDELARQLRQSERGLKVLYLTGYSDRLFKEKVSLWVDEAFLEKPFTSKGLREALSLLVFGRLANASEPDAAPTLTSNL